MRQLIVIDNMECLIADVYVLRLRFVRGRRDGGVVLRSFALAMTLEASYAPFSAG